MFFFIRFNYSKLMITSIFHAFDSNSTCEMFYDPRKLYFFVMRYVMDVTIYFLLITEIFVELSINCFYEV